MSCTASILRWPRSYAENPSPARSPPRCSHAFSRSTESRFQLLAIVEQHTAMRLRRQTERVRGETEVQGTFASLIAGAAGQGTSAEEMRGLLVATRVRPVITAHPTEAKRVTVLEKHRRIYRLLVELEQPRWTARERAGFIDLLRDEIALLWMTGELRLEKPTVDQEVAWGLHFFHETLFDGVPDLLKKLDRALDHVYPGEHPALTPFFQFGSWIGGDRDGNPFVTNDVTFRALRQNALASLRHYEQHISSLLLRMSIAERALPPSPAFPGRAHGRHRGKPRKHCSAECRRTLPAVPRVHAVQASADNRPRRKRSSCHRLWFCER